MGNINISTARTKAYAKEHRTMNNEHYPKQTQSKPISNAQTAYPACQTRDCRVASLLAMTRCMSYSGWNDATLRGPGSVGSKGMCEEDFQRDSDKGDSAEGLYFGFEEVAEAFADADAEVG